MNRREWRWEVDPTAPFGVVCLRLDVITHDSRLGLSVALPDLPEMYDAWSCLSYIVARMTDTMTRAIPSGSLGGDDAPK